MDDALISDAAAELLGAAIVTFFAAGSLLVEASSLGPEPGLGLLGIAAVTGTGYALAVAITQQRSGGHVNPIVSVTAWLTARISATRAGVYVLAQTAGGVLGAALLTSLFPDMALQGASFGATTVDASTGALSALTWELLLGFVYTMAALAVLLDRSSPSLGPLAVGAGAFLAVALAGPFTGASMNPARSFGPALLSGAWEMHWVYWVGPLLGGALAGGVYDGVVKQAADGEEDAEAVDEADADARDAQP